MSDHPRQKQFIYNDCLIATATIQHINVTTRRQVDGRDIRLLYDTVTLEGLLEGLRKTTEH